MADIFEDCQESYDSDKPQFLTLLENHIDLDSIIPLSFINHFYASTGRPRKYSLSSMLWALIIQRIFSIPTDSLLLVFLNYSKHLREFCGFTKVPDTSKITRFKQEFLPDLQIVRHLNLYNQDFLESHPELIPNKKSDSPDEDKAIHDARLLIPTLSDFFKAHPLINPKTFLGDAAFDSTLIYKELLNGGSLGIDESGKLKHFEKAYIPLNSRSSLSKESDCPINKNGIPCCPKDPKSEMKSEGKTMTKSGIIKYKTRTSVERSINHFKDSFCLSGRKIQNEETLHADLILAGITQLITVVLADAIHQHQFIRSLKPLITA